MLFKTIITGRFQFHSPRSFRNALELFNHRGEIYYKNDIALKSEDIFSEEELALIIPRHICQVAKKTWKSTINLLEYTAQFSLSGNIEAWMIESGKALQYAFIEPKSDKQAVRCFLKGREMLEIPGKETEAIEYFTKAINKFEDHAQALQHRGEAYLSLGEFNKAKADFEEGLSKDMLISSAHLGLGKVALQEEKLEDAVSNFDQAIKHSIPMQPKYWLARRMKGECLLALEEFDKASVEFKFFTNRNFEEGDPNKPNLKKAYFDYGRSLMAIGKYEPAIAAFSKSAELEEATSHAVVEEDEVLVMRGLARKKAGKEDFEKDWRKAAKIGSLKAKRLLAEAAA